MTEEYLQNLEDRKLWQRPWFWLAFVVVIILLAIFLLVPILQGDEPTATVNEATEINFAEVVITDLVQEEEFNGTLGTVADDPIKTMLSGTITDIPESGTTISQGEMLFAVDNQPVVLLYGDLPAYRDLAIGEYPLTVASQLSGTITWLPEPGTVIEQGDVIYRVDDEPVIALYGEQPVYRPLMGSFESEITTGEGTKSIISYLSGYDVFQLEEALVELGYDPRERIKVDTLSTEATDQLILDWQRDVGAIIDGIVHFGELVFLPGPAHVLEVFAVPGDSSGNNVMVVSTGEPTASSDVLQLEEALLSLGYDADGGVEVDGVYTPETTQAVLAFQENEGLVPDGIMNLGEVVFLSGDVRVKEQISTKGSNVGIGADVLGISLSEKIVKVDLPANEQGTLAVGDMVIVEMPDNSEAPASVVYISQSAIPGETQFDSATFEVRIAFDNPDVAVGLDEAPVDVRVVSASAEDVLAIPVSALVALLEGGYAVEVDRGAGRVELIAVEVGFLSSNNLVQITAGALSAGDRVVIP